MRGEACVAWHTAHTAGVQGEERRPKVSVGSLLCYGCQNTELPYGITQWVFYWSVHINSPGGWRMNNWLGVTRKWGDTREDRGAWTGGQQGQDPSGSPLYMHWVSPTSPATLSLGFYQRVSRGGHRISRLVSKSRTLWTHHLGTQGGWTRFCLIN